MAVSSHTRAALCLVVAAVCIQLSAASYFPKIIDGTPKSAQATGSKPFDYRGQPVYRVEFTTVTESGEEVSSLVHRQYEEFEKLNEKIRGGNFFLPSRDDLSLDTLTAYLQSIIDVPEAKNSKIFSAFLGINWNAEGIKWFDSLESFLYMITAAYIPEFSPEPAVIDQEEDAFEIEVPFEKWVYMMGFRSQTNIKWFQEFFKNTTMLSPAWEGAADNSDVWPDNSAGVEMPYHYARAPVHFLPGGYLNGQTVRTSFTGSSKFRFLDEKNLEEAVVKYHGHRKPKRILDMGTGNCFGAFVYAKQFPNAEVVGIDLSAPYIRACRAWAKKRGVKNVSFYQDNAESTHFQDNTFDIIQYSYVLHEMPNDNANDVIKEAFRLLVPGGVFSGFEVPFFEDRFFRQAVITSQTWGYKWDSDGPFGPEPFTKEYQNKVQLPRLLPKAGFVDNYYKPISEFDAVYMSHKPQK